MYIDPDLVIYDAMLNQTNAGNNNNKFYRLQLLQGPSGQYVTWSLWGRIGDRASQKDLGTGSLQQALSGFEKKFKEKTGYNWSDRSSAQQNPKAKKYTFLPGKYEADSGDEDEEADATQVGSSKVAAKGKSSSGAKSQLHLAVQDLMRLIFDEKLFQAAMEDMQYDSRKLPLGHLSTSTIEQGYLALRALSQLFSDPSLALPQYGKSYSDAVGDLSNRYLTLIPHVFPRSGVPLIDSHDKLKNEVELLDSLSDMRIAEKITKSGSSNKEDDVHPVDRHYAGLEMTEMTALDPSSQEYQQLHEYLIKTHGVTHDVDYNNVEAIFRIE